MPTDLTRWRGVIASITTPFDAGGKIDISSLQKETEYLTSVGVHGICVGGTVSEMSGASAGDIHLLCRTVVSATKEPVIASIFPDCTSEALLLAEAAASAGIRALLVAPPHYLFIPDQAGLVELFSHLRKALTVPLLVSNCIETAQVSLPSLMELMKLRLVDGIHQAAGNAHLLADLLRLNPRVPVWTGVEDLIYLAFLLGAEGAISALAAVFPEDCVALYEASRRGDSTSALEIHEKLNRLWRVLDHPVEFLSRIKWALNLQQRDAGVPRSPYNVISGESQRILREALERREKLPN
jgi:4-hydroxy-tetrahydrodipicolinate synthase